jgi:biopolymer transport protein ExbD
MRVFKYNRLFEVETFDMTPIIDVVFLLIIFFMLVAQFIVAEQFKVSVPDEIVSSLQQETEKDSPLTITVMLRNQEVVCAVGSETLASVQGKDMKSLITSTINEYLKTHQAGDKTVRLRCDRAVPFGQVKHILSGISQSQAESVDWAVFSE